MSKANRASQSILPLAQLGSKWPPWPISCLLALQHLLVQVSFLCVFHFIFIAELAKEQLKAIPSWDGFVAHNLFACGISTVIQCSLGTRLPLVQGPTFEFLIPAMVLIQQMAPVHQSKENSTEASEICAGLGCENIRNPMQLFHEITGAVVVSGVIQMLLGVTGVCGWIVHHCGPMVLAPSLSVIGLSAYKPAALLCSENWIIAVLLVLLCILISQHLASFRLPHCQWSQTKGLSVTFEDPALHMFSVLLPFCSIWVICGILRPVAIPWHSLHPSVQHLNLSNSTLQSPWFKIPYPGEQGWPVLSTHAIGIGAAMGVTASVNSIGCYLLCSKALKNPPPLRHSCNRGLCAEGLGSLLSALLGSMSGTASSMSNACASSLTQATSYRSVWIGALACIVLGLSPRLMGFLTTIPLGIHGGVLCVTYSVAVGTGVSYFQYTDIDSGRNIFIVGFTMFMGLLVPKWLFGAPGSLTTGYVPLDLFLLSLLMVPSFITGFLSFFLENTVSGTLQERGLLNPLSTRNLETGSNSLQHKKEEDSAQRCKLPLNPQRHLPPSWCKGFPFCLLCPLEKSEQETMNHYPLSKELHHLDEETTDLLVKSETVKLESEIKLETEKDFKIMQGNLENHNHGRSMVHEVIPLC
ncbi:solute carrier family 23 member 3 isoform X2 [Erythrolamprus reginae]|uniref:solute carrier family 23 member 3 isoform X2 n=2 Tax=Erythrolamprus reginae TaxID=121349 RepID=UPI00396C8419